jgi:hypothetical protein
MKTATRLTVAERDRALGLLHDLTIGTTMAGLLAAGALGGLAAASKPATSGTATVVGSASTSNTTATTGGATAATGSTSAGTSGTTAATGGTTIVGSLQSAAQALTPSTGQAQVTSGGS